jgi:hypothetical protein
MKSATLAACRALGHEPTRHSPDAVDIILECSDCCMAWLVQGITGRETRLPGSTYERRLIQQRIERDRMVTRPPGINARVP